MNDVASAVVKVFCGKVQRYDLDDDETEHKGEVLIPSEVSPASSPQHWTPGWLSSERPVAVSQIQQNDLIEITVKVRANILLCSVSNTFQSKIKLSTAGNTHIFYFDR